MTHHRGHDDVELDRRRFQRVWGDTLQDLYDEMNGWSLDEVGRCSWHPSLNLEWDNNQVVPVGR